LASGIRNSYDETPIEGTLINLSLLGAYVVCNQHSEEDVHGLKCIYSLILSINKKRLYMKRSRLMLRLDKGLPGEGKSESARVGERYYK
jgi:hypothetical protein